MTGSAAEEAPKPRGPSDATASRQRFVRFTSADGLSLSVTTFGDPASPGLPLVCLPGFSRNARDFFDLAEHILLDSRRPRFIACFDFRGRGRSDWDADPANYNPLTEMDDVFDGMAALAIERAVVVGTSRGGIVAMMMNVARPSAVAGVVLNDIGPTIEPLGLARIKSYVGRTPLPDDWDDAVSILQRLHGGQFPALGGADWAAWARATYRDLDGRPAQDYDPALQNALSGIDFDEPMPTLWNEYRALAEVPCLVIRGANSDILSDGTLQAMKAAHPRLQTVTVPGQGHPPQLRGYALLEVLSEFVRSTEDKDTVRPRDIAAR